jgi:hypothetical protein
LGENRTLDSQSSSGHQGSRGGILECAAVVQVVMQHVSGRLMLARRQSHGYDVSLLRCSAQLLVLTTTPFDAERISVVQSLRLFISVSMLPAKSLHLIVASTLNIPAAAHALPVAHNPGSCVPFPRRMCAHSPVSVRNVWRYSWICLTASCTRV